MNLSQHTNGLEIAIVGMSGCFPGATNIEAFWQNLREGVESVSFFSDEELRAAGVEPTLLHDSSYVKAKAVLADIDRFDADFFGFSPKEAELIDPQQRLFLESAWEAIEHAGYCATAYQGSIGVYAGVETNTYLINNICPHFGGIPDLQTFLSNAADYLATRVSYKLNLKGPAVTVQTACSTSLVAVHMAGQSLLNGECDMALAGGVSVTVPQRVGYFYQTGGIMSPDGHCRAFDARAQGCCSGSGVGIVVLKRLSDAIEDGDCIHALIKGSAINNDGALKVGYTAPSPEGQAAVIAEAHAVAGIDPETITYLETHGTGTALGDPIELTALTEAFRHKTHRKAFCAIGSVKTNIGHLSIAAGIASLIKTVLALKHQQIPPSLHFEQPNPKIDFASSPFYVNIRLSPWQTQGRPRRAGVSSFGMGGTNAHVILESAPPPVATNSPSWQLLTLSAKTSSALESATANLVAHLKQHPHLDLADVAYTLHMGRQSFQYRQAVVSQTLNDAVSALQDPKRILTSVQETIDCPIAFMFTGLGTQYVNMAGELYQTEPTFREQVDRCCQILMPLLDLDLRDILYPDRNHAAAQPDSLIQSTPPSGFNLRQMLGRDAKPADASTQTLNQTRHTQPAIFVIEYALAQLWMSWGIRPAAMIGYSIGEYVAACLAGVLSLEEALTLVAQRAQLIEALPPGAMLAVPVSEAEARLLLTPQLSLSAINGANLCVIAGTPDAIDELATQLTTKGLACRRLQTSHAFHSDLMQPIAAACTAAAKAFNPKAPQISYLSNVTGTWMTAADATDPAYWTKHLCQPVRFADGVNALWKQHQPILLEVGPGQTLSSLAQQCLDPTAEKVVLPSLRDAYNQQSDRAFLLNTVGQLWLSGVEIDWSAVYQHQRRYRLPLPTYPFERQRYWIDPPHPGQMAARRRTDPADWFYIPAWKQSMPPLPFTANRMSHPFRWLIFVDNCGIGSHLAQRLEHENQEVICVRAGVQFRQLSDRSYEINPCASEDYMALLQELRDSDRLPDGMVHAWSIQLNASVPSGIEYFEAAQQSGFYSVLFLIQAFSKQLRVDPMQLWVLSTGMHRVESTDAFDPAKAPLLGLCKVIPQEYSSLTCRSIDLALPETDVWTEEQLIEQLMAELTGDASELVIAYRRNYRWLQTFEAVRLDDRSDLPRRLRQSGVYLITGGLGGIGLTLARYLAETVQAKLVLVGRSGLPPQPTWEEWLATHEANDPITTKITQVQNLEQLGAEVLVIQADVANEHQMQSALLQTEARFGSLNGVIHAAAFLGGTALKTIQETEYSDCTLQFQPKVYGLYTLEKVLRGRMLDYCLLISSIGSILGGVAVAVYAAANGFMDAFAHQQHQLGNSHWCSANWFHAEHTNWLRHSRQGVTQTEDEQVKFRQETIEAFQRIVSYGSVPQISLWRSPINAEIDKWIKRQPKQSEAQSTSSPEQTYLSYSRSNLRTTYVAASNPTERQIAQRFQQTLGIEPVGIHDNFFDLGGHSLIGTQLIAQLRQDFQVELPITLLFEAPSVAELALVIEDILIKELEGLTEAAAERLISAYPN